MRKNKILKIGVFDSGIGGLSVLKSLLSANFFDEIIYYGDTARVPYGVKDKKTIIDFSLQALDFFTPHNIDMLILACNTASAYALDEMRKKSHIPIIGVIEPGVLALKNKIKDINSSILILATKATINSAQYQNYLQKLGYSSVQALATGLFVPIVEEGIFEGNILDTTMQYYFSSIKTPPKGIILGCTHFPLISKEIQKYFGNESLLIHSGEAIIEYLRHNHNICLKDTQKQTKVSFYASSDIDNLKKTADIWLNI